MERLKEYAPYQWNECMLMPCKDVIQCQDDLKQIVQLEQPTHETIHERIQTELDSRKSVQKANHETYTLRSQLFALRSQLGL